jgi:hypothetical protein
VSGWRFMTKNQTHWGKYTLNAFESHGNRPDVKSRFLEPFSQFWLHIVNSTALFHIHLRQLNASLPITFSPAYPSILSVIKNQGPYLAEWSEYHLLVSIEKFLSVMNNNDNNISVMLAPYTLPRYVMFSSWNGEKQQDKIYTHHVLQSRNITCWVALIDADEFLFPVKHIPVLKSFDDSKRLRLRRGIGWYLMQMANRNGPQDSDSNVFAIT